MKLTLEIEIDEEVLRDKKLDVADLIGDMFKIAAIKAIKNKQKKLRPVPPRKKFA